MKTRTRIKKKQSKRKSPATSSRQKGTAMQRQSVDTTATLQSASHHPQTLSPNEVLHLQRTIGNQATIQMLQSPPDVIQKKGGGNKGDKHADELRNKIMKLIRKSNEIQVEALAVTDNAAIIRKAIKKQSPLLESWDKYMKELMKLQVSKQSDKVDQTVLFAQKAREKLSNNQSKVQDHLNTIQTLPAGVANSQMVMVDKDDFKGDWKKDLKKLKDDKVKQATTAKKANSKIIKPAKKIKSGIEALSAGTAHEGYSTAIGESTTHAGGTIMEFLNVTGIKFAIKLVMAIKAVKNKFDGWRKWADVEKQAKTRVKGNDTPTQEETSVYESAKYAARKTVRAFMMALHKMAGALVKTIARIVSFVTGGLSAPVTEAIVLATAIEQKAVNLALTIKGLYKHFTNKRGKNRNFNAATLIEAAAAGDDVALDMMIDMKLFAGLEEKEKMDLLKDTMTQAYEGKDTKALKSGLGQGKDIAKEKIKDGYKSFVSTFTGAKDYTGPQTRPNMLVWLQSLSPDSKKAVRKILANKMKSK